jgi:hypothetical protein
MPKSYEPFHTAAPSDVEELNERFQQKEDYFLALLGIGLNVQQRISGDAGENLSDRDAAYFDISDGNIYKMDGDAASPKAGIIRGFVDGSALTGASATLVISGLMDGFAGLSGFGPVYVDTIPGSITQTRPSPVLGGGQIMIAEMGFSTASDTIFVRPRPIQYLLRDEMADNDVLTVAHHADAEGYNRKVLAYMTEAVAGSELATYASANRDSDVALQLASYTADLCTGGTASASSSVSSTTALHAFDGDPTGTRWAGDVGSGVWLKYDFGAAITKTVRRYTLTTYTDLRLAPKTWTFEGSNDNTNWTVLDSQVNVPQWTVGESRTYDFSNATAYRYVRWLFTAAQTGSVIEIANAECMESIAGYEKLAQTFVLGSSADIGEADLWLKKVGSPTGTATLRIETVSGGSPTGTLVHANATATFAESGLGTSYATETVVFEEFNLGAGTYALVLETDRAAHASNYIHWGADGSSPGYASGEMKTYDGAAWSAASKDAIFTLRDVSVYHPSWMKVEHWNSSHADLVNRYGLNGDDHDTKTSFKNVLDAGFDDVTVVVELN